MLQRPLHLLGAQERRALLKLARWRVFPATLWLLQWQFLACRKTKFSRSRVATRCSSTAVLSSRSLARLCKGKNEGVKKSFRDYAEKEADFGRAGAGIHRYMSALTSIPATYTFLRSRACCAETRFRNSLRST